ncbi:MAG: glutamate racemase [Puniceicoccales bacterium]|jgi:glutamate racemase|nr:glutamate racemase [Puniceicoccales bacterium]
MSFRKDPIGMFDSGVGGLSILDAVTKVLPGETVHYFADNAHCPYGARTQAEVTAFCEGITRFLLARQCKLIVVACNTATAMAIDSLRKNFGVPFVGIEPAVKPAVLKSRTGAIGVLATAGTFRGRLFKETLARFAQGTQVLTAEGTGLVELVEAGRADSPETEALLRGYLKPMLEAGIDQLVLGCTHYPFLGAAIQRITGGTVTLISPGEAVAVRVRSLLETHALLADTGTGGLRSYYSSGDTAALSAMLGGIAEVKRTEWEKGKLLPTANLPGLP